jgi:shikimate dehydrogenase
MRKFGLIGYPLGQSFSRQYFTDKFVNEQLPECSYESYPIPTIENINAILEDPDLEGLNVTIPYKKAVIRFLHEQDDVVKQIQACNCINIKKGVLKGYNTDVIGFEKSLIPLLKPHHKKALILGTGGSSAAVEYVLQKLNIEYLFVSRTSDKTSNAITYSEVDQNVLETYNIIINTTPLGMFPEVDNSPDIPYQFLTEKNLLYDLVYNPAKTLFLKKGEEQGATIKNGAEMLIIQAEESWRIWNGKAQ